MKKLLIRKIIVSFLISIIAFFPVAVLGSTSLSALANPQTATMLGIKAATAAPIVPAASSAVPVAAQVLSPSGAVLGTAFAGSFTPVASTTTAIAVAGGAVGVAGVTAAAISQLQQTAYQKYCSQNSSVCSVNASTPAPVGGHVWATLSFEEISPGVWRWSGKGFDWRANNFAGSCSPNPADEIVSGQIVAPFGLEAKSAIAVFGQTTCTGIVPYVKSPPLTWQNFTQSQRDSACDLLVSNDYSQITNQIDNSSSVTTSSFNFVKNYITNNFNNTTHNRSDVITNINNISFSVSPKLVLDSANNLITINNNLSINQFDQLFQTNISSEIENYINNNFSATINNNNNNSTNITGTITNTQINTETGQQTQTQSQINLQIPEPEGSIPNTDCQNVNCPSFFNKPNFIQYGIEKFSNKFPFDVLGDVESLSSLGGGVVCPTFSIYGRDKPMCEIRNLFQISKYGIWSSFIVNMIRNL